MSHRARPLDLDANADFAAVLTRRYLLGLGLVAALVVVNQWIVQPPLVRLMTDAPLINIAGRQRMLSQKLAKTALALEMASNTPEAQQARVELSEVLELFSSSQENLVQNETARSARWDSNGEILDEFQQLQPAFDQIRTGAVRVINSAEPAETHDSRTQILQAEAAFLPRMEKIVGLYERQARAHVDRLIVIGWMLALLVLFALGGIGWFLLRPTARIIDRQVVELRKARDELELRVAERTRELAEEVERRSTAEERQRTMLQQFSRVARTNTIGEMASGLAHELNQPLGAIANYAEGCLVALQHAEPAIDEVRAALDKLRATTLRAGAIVKRIRQFVTRAEMTREPFDPARLVQDVVEFLHDDSTRRGITLRAELAPELPYPWADSVQIQQVLVNLVRNAIDAIVAAKPQPVTPVIVIRVTPARSGGVEFAVIDNGEGIPADRLAQIFDAYFSTRDEGMGMGLAISRTILETHDTRFVVESDPGVGTTFRFTLSSAVATDARTDSLHR